MLNKRVEIVVEAYIFSKLCSGDSFSFGTEVAYCRDLCAAQPEFLADLTSSRTYTENSYFDFFHTLSFPKELYSE
jgi:hypothetical protein